jgi:hypothetical protein
MALREGTLGQLQTRADRVRARRARQPRTVEPAPRERAPKKRRRKRPRRRYDIPIDRTNGVEARVPAVPTVRMGTRWLSLALSVLVLGVMGKTSGSASFRIRTTEVRGSSLLTSGQVRSIAHVEGESAFFVDPEEVEKRLLEFPEVMSAQVSMRWPDGMQIDIEERTPMVAWEDAGRVWWLSSDGIAFIPRDEALGLVRVQSNERVLDIESDSLLPVVQPRLLRLAASLQAKLPEGEHLIYDSTYGLGYLDPRGWEVYFGKDGDMQQKVRVYEAIKTHLEDRSIPAAFVSVESVSAPYYSMVR